MSQGQNIAIDQQHYIAVLTEENQRLNGERLLLMALLRQRDAELVTIAAQAVVDEAATADTADG
jgi:hypothetical protein